LVTFAYLAGIGITWQLNHLNSVSPGKVFVISIHLLTGDQKLGHICPQVSLLGHGLNLVNPGFGTFGFGFYDAYLVAQATA